MPAQNKNTVQLAINPGCFSGFDPWVAYNNIPRTGIRYVEVPALPVPMGAKYDLTTFAPEAMSREDVELIKNRRRGMGLIPLTVGAFCDLLDSRQLEALRVRVDFAQ